MVQTSCPNCRNHITCDDPITLGKPLICTKCGEEWVVSNIHPLRLDYEQDGPGEDPDHSVRSRSRGPFRAVV
jgi:hypothetical protein